MHLPAVWNRPVAAGARVTPGPRRRNFGKPVPRLRAAACPRDARLPLSVIRHRLPGLRTMPAVFLDYATVSFDGDLDPALAARRVARSRDPGSHGAAGRSPRESRGARSCWSTSCASRARSSRRRPALRLIALAATGTNNVDLVAARERGVAVCNLRDYCTASVVQHVFGVLLLLTQQAARVRRAGALGRLAARRAVLPARLSRSANSSAAGSASSATARSAAAWPARRTAFGMEVLVANRPGGDCGAGRDWTSTNCCRRSTC